MRARTVERQQFEGGAGAWDFPMFYMDKVIGDSADNLNRRLAGSAARLTKSLRT
jgi:hypothetical protein